MKFRSTTITFLCMAAGLGLLTLTPASAMASTAAAVDGKTSTTPPGGLNSGASVDNSKATSQTIKMAQQVLDGDGQKVRIDGIWGPATQNAVKAYQKLNGLTVTGQLDQATQERMKL